MKKLMAVLALTLALMMGVGAMAQETETPFYSISEDGKVLTVSLAANVTTGYEWNFVLPEESALEMLTQEYVTDEAPEGMVGVGGTWIASFACVNPGCESDVTLTLQYARSWEKDVEPAQSHELVVHVAADGTLSV